MYDVLGDSQGIPDSHVVCLARSVWEFVVGDFLGNTFQTVGMLARCFTLGKTRHIKRYEKNICRDVLFSIPRLNILHTKSITYLFVYTWNDH